MPGFFASTALKAIRRWRVLLGGPLCCFVGLGLWIVLFTNDRTADLSSTGVGRGPSATPSGSEIQSANAPELSSLDDGVDDSSQFLEKAPDAFSSLGQGLQSAMRLERLLSGELSSGDPEFPEAVADVLVGSLSTGDKEKMRQVDRIIRPNDVTSLIPEGVEPTEEQLSNVKAMREAFYGIASPRAEAVVDELFAIRESEVRSSGYLVLPAGSIPDSPRGYPDQYYRRSWMASTTSFSLSDCVIHYRFASNQYPEIEARVAELKDEALALDYEIGKLLEAGR